MRHLGQSVSLSLPHIHAITGCDTTSYLHGVGKIRVLNKVKKNPPVTSLLTSLGVGSGVPERYDDIVNFVRTVCYSGNKGESLVETRVRLYQKQKVKGSQSLPADPDSMKQAVLRMNHQLYYWIRSHLTSVEIIPLDENGWEVDEETNQVYPVWFTG